MLGIVPVLVFLSGAAGLLYEVVWTRLLVHSLGSTAQAVASVLAAFLGGLAVGAAALGRRADRAASPLRFYALLEGVLALFALLFPLLNVAFREVVLAAEGANHAPAVALAALRFLGTFVLLMPATAAMGGTIPVLCKLAIVRDTGVGRPAGALYAWNTLGATIGCLLTGFLLIPALGLSATLHVGAATNVVVALSALALASRARQGRSASEAATPAHAPSPKRAPAAGASPATASTTMAGTAAAPPLSASQRIVLIAFALSGLTALAYEVLWTRVLVFFVKSVTYGFSLMLATFLAGLVLGSAVCAPFADRKRFAPRALPAIELAAGFVAYASIRLLITRPEALRALAPTPGGALGALYGPLVFLVVATILPAGILFGATFPLAVRLVADHAKEAPGRVGLATAANTGGAILGAFLGGFVLLPKLGLVRSLTALAAVNVVAALALTSLFETRRSRAVFGAVALAALAALAPSHDFFVECLARIRPGQMIFVDEGPDVLVNVYEEPPERPDEPPVRTVYVNGSSYTGSRFFARRYMKTMAHLPLLLCEEPRRALVICLGTGMTLSAVARHHELQRVACAELSPGVKKALPLFDAVNDRVEQRPDVHIVIQDGRHWLQTDPDRWDVITLEPPPPLNAGVGDLYSKEFYEICRDRLAPGGILCQWFPMHSQTVEEYRMGLATFLDVFPDASLWLPVGRNAFAIGVKPGGTPWTFDRLRSRFADPPIAAALAEIGFPTPESVLATFVLDAGAMSRFVGDVPLVTDDRPRLEFHDLRAAARRFPAGELLRDLMAIRVDPTRMLEAQGRGAGIDHAQWARTSAALAHFYRGAFYFEMHHADDAAREWEAARQGEPENAYYRSIVGGAGTAPRAEG